MRRALHAVRRGTFALRPEEAASFLLYVGTAIGLSGVAFSHSEHLTGAAAGYPTALVRLAGLFVSAALFLFLIRLKPEWRFARDCFPFVFAASVYASLHDLIRFYGAPDITADLYRWDVALFGVEPTLWASRFIQPGLTDFLTVCYWLFYVMGPLLGLILYLRRDYAAFRATMVSIVICLYLGYIGYVAWPASAPRLFMPHAYAIPLHGLQLLDSSRSATVAVPLTAYGAFPSLHCAVAALAVLLAFRYQRWFAWVQLPFAAGLVFGTVYLRHHWVVDILAGFVLTGFSFWAGPRVETWWKARSYRVVGQPKLVQREATPVPQVAAKVMES